MLFSVKREQLWLSPVVCCTEWKDKDKKLSNVEKSFFNSISTVVFDGMIKTVLIQKRCCSSQIKKDDSHVQIDERFVPFY